jgi:hypothetical protein
MAQQTIPQRKDHRKLTLMILLIGIFGLMIFTGYSLVQQAQLPGLVTYPDQGYTASDGPFTYDSYPAVIGNYSHQWQSCGIYNEPVASEHALNSMARGAVWVTYQPNLSISEIAALQRMARDREYYIISPNPDQDSPILLNAWGAQLAVNDPLDNRVTLFVSRFRQNAQAPLAGQPCTDGVGTPVRPAGVH